MEIGPRDINNKTVFIARRDTSKKISLDISNCSKKINKILNEIQENLFNTALEFQKKNTFEVNSYKEFKKNIDKGGFVKCGWDGTIETENKIKKETKATIRCIPFNIKIGDTKCIYTQNSAKHIVVFAKAY